MKTEGFYPYIVPLIELSGLVAVLECGDKVGGQINLLCEYKKIVFINNPRADVGVELYTLK